MQADTPQGESVFPTVPTADELAAFIATQGVSTKAQGSAAPGATSVQASGQSPGQIPGSAGSSAEAPIARVSGEPFTQLPLDLYIPPDALEVFLDTFEGPLDLLLYLIKRQNLDILDVPIAEITAQYMKYIGLMETMKLSLAAEYLVMAAMLAEIKSRMLLPRIEDDEDDEHDPRAELIRRLQEYERIKSAAEAIEEMPRMERELRQLTLVKPEIERQIPDPDVSLDELFRALRDVMRRASLTGHHHIARETLSVRARMSRILERLRVGEFCEFSTLFDPAEGRLGVVVTFLAVLELCKEAVVDVVQSEPFAPIYLQPRAESEANTEAAAVSDTVTAAQEDADNGEIDEVDEPASLSALPRAVNQTPSE